MFSPLVMRLAFPILKIVKNNMLIFFVTSDTNAETGVAEARQKLMSEEFYKFINNNDYGESVACLAIIFMCRSPELDFKRRLRFSKKDKILFFDIMLDYYKFVNFTQEQRISELCEQLLSEITFVVKKYRFENFNSDKLMSNLINWFEMNNLIARNE